MQGQAMIRHASPGASRPLDDWWTDLNDDVLSSLSSGPLSAEELGHRLGVSEGSAVSLVMMLARDGKVRLSRIELAD
jgi:hypothetical protein